jgi:D-glycero-alpha-D-manno-heptose-7-phosphate kinase
MFSALAPARIDFAGGYSDLFPFVQVADGAVVNAAINLYAYSSLCVEEGSGVDLYVDNLGFHLGTKDIADIQYDGNFDLLKAVLKLSGVSGGFSVHMNSNIPLGSGLGSSGAMGVSLAGILDRFAEKGMSRMEIADRAFEAERSLGVGCGKQDQYASALGGINYMEFSGEKVDVFPLSLSILTDLEDIVCLCHSGESRFAGDQLQSAIDNYFMGDFNTVNAVANMARIARETREALIHRNFVEFGYLVAENWYYQKRIHSAISNEHIDELVDLALSSGAVGGKACGAGGGGCLVFVCHPGRKQEVCDCLSAAGAQVIDFSFDSVGYVSGVV